jgi:tRNA(His) 5'-end guanylyltransferase
MWQVIHDLLDDQHADVAYHQSDEITLVWRGTKELPFGGRVLKLTSVLAGLASASFGRAVARQFGDDMADRLPHFDCRVWQVPDEHAVIDALLWREDDATKNSVSMLAREHYGPRELHGRNTGEQIAMLERVNVRWDLLPDHVKRGSYWRRRTVERFLTDAERNEIPAAQRPDPAARVTRTEIAQIAMPPIRRVGNVLAVWFDGAAPVTREVVREA